MRLCAIPSSHIEGLRIAINSAHIWYTHLLIFWKTKRKNNLKTLNPTYDFPLPSSNLPTLVGLSSLPRWTYYTRRIHKYTIILCSHKQYADLAIAYPYQKPWKLRTKMISRLIFISKIYQIFNNSSIEMWSIESGLIFLCRFWGHRGFTFKTKMGE